MNSEFLNKFIEDTKEEVSKLPYKKYFYQYSEEEKNILSKDMKDIVDYFKAEFELDVYPVYGTLLGMMREKDFIGHDTDIDMAYMSKCHTEKAVLNEFNMLCNCLKERGLLLKKIKTASHIHLYSPNKHLRIDMWISWIGEDGKYYLTWIFDGEFSSDILYPFGTVEFRGNEFLLMNGYNEFLNFQYQDWLSPISGGENNWKKRPCVFRLEPWINE